MKTGGAINTSWKKRYFVLTSNALKYFVNDTLEEQLGSISLNQARIFDVDETFSDYKENSLGILPVGLNRTYILAVENSELRATWLNALASVADQHSTDSILMQGELTKLSKGFKRWKRRHFVLTPHTLTYYKDKALCEQDQPAGEVNLLFGGTVRPEADEKYNHKLTFIVSPNTPTIKKGRDYVLYADTELELRDWIRKIQDAFSKGPQAQVTTVTEHDTSEKESNQYIYHRQMAGFLKKRGDLVKNWKNRYFVLSGVTLFYFKEQAHASQQGWQDGFRPTGTINIFGSQLQEGLDFGVGFGFSVTPKDSKRRYLLVAESADVCKQWLLELNNAKQDLDAENLRLSALGDLQQFLSQSPNSPTSTPTNLSTKHKFNFMRNNDQKLDDILSAPLVEMVEEKDQVDPDSVCEGWLLKLADKGRLLHHRWHKRYFVLTSTDLLYFDSRPSSINSPKSSLPLSGLEVHEKHKYGNLYVLKCRAINAENKTDKEYNWTLGFPSGQTGQSTWKVILKETSAKAMQAQQKDDHNLKQGYLYSYSDKKWRHQFVVLSQNQLLRMYPSHKKVSGIDCFFTMSLQGASIQMLPNDEYDRECTFMITTEDQELICSAESREELEAWVKVM